MRDGESEEVVPENCYVCGEDEGGGYIGWLLMNGRLAGLGFATSHLPRWNTYSRDQVGGVVDHTDATNRARITSLDDGG